MGGPFTDKLRRLSGEMAKSASALLTIGEKRLAEGNDEVAATLNQAARAIELLEAELEDAKR